jgi:hypothetical protein
MLQTIQGNRKEWWVGMPPLQWRTQTIKQRKGSVHINLKSHILSCYPNIFTNDSTSNLLDFIRPKCTNLYGLMKK